MNAEAGQPTQPAAPTGDQTPRRGPGQAASTLPPVRPRRRWLTALLAVVLFLGGMFFGAALMVIVILNRVQYAIHHPEEAPARMTKRLAKTLKLTPKQAGQVRQVLERRYAAAQEIRRDVYPRVEAELNKVQQEIGETLSDKQRTKWQDLFTRLRQRWMAPPPPPRDQPASRE